MKSRDELDISDEPQGMIRSAITPQPLVALVFCAVVFLIFAIFVFGARGKYPDVDISDFLRTLAVGALAAAITTIIDRQVAFRHLSRSIESSLRSAAGVARSIDELGIQAVHKRFDYGLIFREARRGETVSWLDTYCPRQNEFVDDIIDCLQRSVHVRMLTIEPGCQNERFRNLELESTVDTGGGWDAGLAAFISKMKAISAKGREGTFEIRMYSDLPCAPIYLISKGAIARRGYFSIYLVRASASCPHVELRSGELLRDMAKYFDAKWARQEPIEVGSC